MKKVEEIYTKDEQATYALHKLIYYLIFTDNHETYKQVESFAELDFLTNYKDVVEQLVEEGFLSKAAKNNIYDFLLYLREVDDDKKIERNKIIGDITGIVNCQVDDNTEYFYKSQLYIRRNQSFKKPYDLTNDMIEDIDDSICCDYLVVASHLPLYTTDSEFLEQHLENLTDNITYLESLNFVLMECPSLFLEPTFKKRMNLCLENSKNETIKTLSKKLSKTTKRVTKGIEG